MWPRNSSSSAPNFERAWRPAVRQDSRTKWTVLWSQAHEKGGPCGPPFPDVARSVAARRQRNPTVGQEPLERRNALVVGAGLAAGERGTGDGVRVRVGEITPIESRQPPAVVQRRRDCNRRRNS